MAEMGAVGWARRFQMRAGVRAGRDWAREHLQLLGWDRSTPEQADAVVLAVSELLTNAHVHARSDAELVLAWDGTHLHLSVHDHSPQLPRPRRSGPQEIGGRGLALVEAVSDHWHTQEEGDGKSVVACFHPAKPTRYPHG